jgi:cell volume regulation protein A
MPLSVMTSGSGVDILLIAISFIIILGYLSEAIFRITKLPEVLILMAIGIILGPIGHLLPGTYISTLRSLTPLFGSIALVMIMFNGGRIIKLRKESLSDKTGYVLALADIIVPGIVLALFMDIVFGWPPIYGALLGVMLGETSSIMIIPLLKRIKISPKMYNTIVIETTFNSVFAILIFYLLFASVQGVNLSAVSYVQYIISYISIALLIGLLAGFGWLFVQNIFKGARSYIATIAIAILLYGIVDFLNGSAVVSVLVYAIIIGNSKTINEYLNMARLEESKYALAVEHEMEFLVRTFFFVLLGMVSFLSIYYFLFAVAITAMLIAIRKIEVHRILRGKEKYEKLVFGLMPRGLTVAVLSSIFYATGYPYSQRIFYISFVVLILTNIMFGILTRRAAKEL